MTQPYNYAQHMSNFRNEIPAIEADVRLRMREQIRASFVGVLELFTAAHYHFNEHHDECDELYPNAYINNGRFIMSVDVSFPRSIHPTVRLTDNEIATMINEEMMSLSSLIGIVQFRRIVTNLDVWIYSFTGSITAIVPKTPLSYIPS